MPKVIHALENYKQFIGVNDIIRDDTSEVTRFKEELNTKLTSQNDMLRSDLNLLSEEQKSSLIAALITNDSTTLKKILLPCLSKVKLDTFAQHLDRITTHEQKEVSDYWLNPTVRLLIAKMLETNIDDPNANARNARILQNAMQQIPESKIHIKAKVSLCREIDYSAASAISDYSYNESLEPLAMNRFSGNITLKEFKTAIQASPLDYSEYLMMTLGLFQNILAAQPDLQADLHVIRQLYLDTEYEEAIKIIIKLAAQHQAMLGEDLVKLITDKSAQLIEIDIHKNYSRRFFENRLSQFYTASPNDLESINKISQYIIKKEVSTIKEAEDAALYISEDASNLKEIKERVDKLKEQSDWYKMKDRYDKTGFSDKEMENAGEVGKEEIYSKNKGMLTSNAPNFYDELSNNEMRNKVVDVASIYGEDVEGYSYLNPRGAFAGSYSGHCFKIVATLERYMKEHTEDPDLSIDINCFIKRVVAAYIDRGYHGFREIVDVLKEPHIQKVFSDCGVLLDSSSLSEPMEKASRDTQEYTKALRLKKAVLSSISQMGLFSKPSSANSDTKLQANKDQDRANDAQPKI